MIYAGFAVLVIIVSIASWCKHFGEVQGENACISVYRDPQTAAATFESSPKQIINAPRRFNKYSQFKF